MRKIPYGKQSINQAEIDSVISVLKSDWLTQGPTVKKFEEKLANYTGAKYAVAVTNGTAALHLACLTAGISNGDEVIIPTLSFVASANCVLYSGATPVLVDVYPDILTINVEEAEKKVTKKTKAIIAVDFAGHPAHWNKLRQLAKKHKLILIDDAAHSLGSKYKNRLIGSMADLTTFSFHPVKTITTGEGGAITTNSLSYYNKLISLRHHGIEKDNNDQKSHGEWYYQINDIGYNYRLTDIQAAIGISQLKKINSFIKKRRQIWQKYKSAFSNMKSIILPIEKEGNFSAWHIYPIRLKSQKERNQLHNYLKQSGIQTQVHYIPIHLLNLYKKRYRYNDDNNFPAAENYYIRTLTLPLYPTLKKEDQTYIIRKVKEALR